MQDGKYSQHQSNYNMIFEIDNSCLRLLTEFQQEIVGMQVKISELRKKNPQSDLSEPIRRVDKLIEIYKMFDSFYFQNVRAQYKIGQLESDILELAKVNEDLKTENEKLLKSIEWK